MNSFLSPPDMKLKRPGCIPPPAPSPVVDALALMTPTSASASASSRCVYKQEGIKVVSSGPKLVKLGGAWGRQEAARLRELAEKERLALECSEKQGRIVELEGAIATVRHEEELARAKAGAFCALNTALSERHVQSQVFFGLSRNALSEMGNRYRVMSESVGAIEARSEEREALRLAAVERQVDLERELRSVTEDNVEVRDLLYASEEDVAALRSALEEQRKQNVLVTKSKEQKEKHIVLLVKEKNRLHEQLEAIANGDPALRHRQRRNAQRRRQQEQEQEERQRAEKEDAADGGEEGQQSQAIVDEKLPESEALVLSLIRKLRRDGAERDRENRKLAAQLKQKSEEASHLQRRLREAARTERMRAAKAKAQKK